MRPAVSNTRQESPPATKGPHTPQFQCTDSARGAWGYPLISPFDITTGRLKGSFIFEQLAKALRDAQLHQSLQVFVFPHPKHVS